MKTLKHFLLMCTIECIEIEFKDNYLIKTTCSIYFIRTSKIEMKILKFQLKILTIQQNTQFAIMIMLKMYVYN